VQHLSRDEDGGDKISSEETTVEEKENITQKMQLFSEKYKKNNKIANNNNYFAVKLVADAKLDFKGPDGEKPDFGRYMDNNSLKEIWLHSLNVREISSGKSYKIDKV